MTEPRPGWTLTWLRAAEAFAPRSKCVNSKVGAVAVTQDNRFSWFGYNGPPRDFPAPGDCVNWCPRAKGGEGSGTSDYSACESIHAEVNALLRADASLLDGGGMYVTRAPCITCARTIANSGIRRVTWWESAEDDPARVAAVARYLDSCRVRARAVPREYP